MTPFATLRACGSIAALALTAAIAAHAQPVETSGSWAYKSPLPGSWTEIVAVAAAGKLYAFSANFPQRSDVEEYDPATDQWRYRAPMPLGLDHVGATVLGGKIYIVGGFTNNRHQGVNNSVFEYDPAADRWRSLAPLSGPRGSVAAAAFGGKIHAFGGRRNETDVVPTHEVYDPSTDSWRPAAPLPRGRDHMAAVTVGDKVHIVGGRFGANEDSTGLHDIYDPATDRYESGPLMPTARGGGSGTLFQGMVVYLGGEDDVRTYNENEGFDVKANRWVKLKPMPAGRHGLGVAAIGTNLYVAGGGKGRGNREMTNELLVFTMP
jgi:hypothetical protein